MILLYLATPFVFMKFVFDFYCRNNFTADYFIQNCNIGEVKYALFLSIVRRKIYNCEKNYKRHLCEIFKKFKLMKRFERNVNMVLGICKQVCVWSTVEYGTKYCYVEVVENRKKATLNPIIEREQKKILYYF
ncbi:hypothetical protein DMUE_5420 [Dictyocoela muelleri]|nr:hypothetical protein DMUE_5420 [Dictyocoela muelleri]